MKDPRLQKLAQNLVGYSINVQPGENVLIEMIGSERELVTMLVDEVAARGGRPFVQLTDRKVLRSLIKNASEEQMKTWREYDLLRMQNMQGYIGIRAGENANEMSDIPEDKMKLYDAIYSHPVHMEERVKRTKWVVLRYPNASMAQLANTSTEAFEDFYFDVCNLDYSKMDKAMESLKALMDRTDKVRLTGPGTDLTFSIRASGQSNARDRTIFRMARSIPRLSAIPSMVR